VSRIFRAGSKTKNRPLLHKGFRKPQSVARINKDTNEKSITLAEEVIEIAQQFPDLPSVQHYAEAARQVLQAISE